MKEVLIIIPAYNEGENIEKVIKEIKEIKDQNIDIVVINDGSSDKTREIVERQGIDVISHMYNLGYGAALQTGYKYAMIKGYKYTVQFDGDGQHDPNDIESIINEIKKNDVDIVSGSRFLGESSYKIGFLKKTVIVFMRFIIKVLTRTNITDPTNGLKGLSRRTFEYYSLSNNFPCDFPDADILIHMLRKKYKVREVFVTVRERQHGKSMHSGLKPIIYLLKILLSINIVLLRELASKES